MIGYSILKASSKNCKNYERT